MFLVVPYLDPDIYPSCTRRFVVPTPVIPDLKNYLDDFIAGVPLLLSLPGTIDLSPAEMMLPGTGTGIGVSALAGRAKASDQCVGHRTPAR